MGTPPLNPIEMQMEPYVRAFLPHSQALWDRLAPELESPDQRRRAFVACLNHFRYMTVENLHFVYRHTWQQVPPSARPRTPLSQAPRLAVPSLLPDFMAVVLMLYPVQEYLTRMIFLSIMLEPPGQLIEKQLETILDTKTYRVGLPKKSKAEERIPEEVSSWLQQRDAQLDAQGRRRRKQDRHLSVWEKFNASHMARHYFTHRFRLPWWKNGPNPPYGFETGVLTHLPQLEAATWEFLVDTGAMEERIKNLRPAKFRSGVHHLCREHEKAARAADAVFEALVDHPRVFPASVAQTE